MTSNTPPAAPMGRSPLDQRVADRLLLQTVAGAEAYLAEDISNRASLPGRAIRIGKGYVEFEHDGSLRPLEASRLFSSGGVLITGGVSSAPPDLALVLTRLRESAISGVLLGVGRHSERPIRFRVGDLGEWRWALRDALVAQLGWVNDPSRWDVNVEIVGEYLVGQLGRLHYSRRIGSLKRQDVSTTPVIAAVLCRLAKLTSRHRVFDPFCGSGTILFDATFWTDWPVVGSDVSATAVAHATENLPGGGGRIFLARAERPAIRSASIDRIISNLPFGKQVGSHADNKRLYPAFLAEVERVLVPDGRAVLLTEEKRLLRQAVESSHLKVLRERALESGGARPSAYVLGFRRPQRMASPSRRRRPGR